MFIKKKMVVVIFAVYKIKIQSCIYMIYTAHELKGVPSKITPSWKELRLWSDSLALGMQ